MNVTVSVTTGTRIDVTSSGQRNVTIASPSSLTLAQVDVLYYPRTNPSGFATGVDNSTLVLRAETGQFYPRSNPSGFITSGQTGNFGGSTDLSHVVFNTGNQTISGNLTVTGFVSASFNHFIWKHKYSSNFPRYKQHFRLRIGFNQRFRPSICRVPLL
jgi:hypothetical protein